MKAILAQGCLILATCLIFAIQVSFNPQLVEAQNGDAVHVLALINEVRVAAGLAPLVENPQLGAAAQAHADDMAKNGVNLGHRGSDLSTPAERVTRAGYPPYSWGVFAGENWAAYRTVEASMDAWMSDKPHRDNILRPQYREIGIGLAYTLSGTPILVTDFGAEPNVLPAWIDGSGGPVILRISNEDAAPNGDGPHVIGHVMTMQISTDPEFSNARVMPYAPIYLLASSDRAAISKVYVRLSDGLGRVVTTIASESPVTLGRAGNLAGKSSPLATRTPTATRRPTALVLASVAGPSLTPMPEESPVLAPVDTEIELSPTPSPLPPSPPSNLRRPAKARVSADTSETGSLSDYEVSSIAGTFFTGAGLMLLLAFSVLKVRNR